MNFVLFNDGGSPDGGNKEVSFVADVDGRSTVYRGIFVLGEVTDKARESAVLAESGKIDCAGASIKVHVKISRDDINSHTPAEAVDKEAIEKDIAIVHTDISRDRL